MCSVYFLMDSKLMESILFGDDLNTEKLRLRRAFYLRFLESIPLSRRPRFCLQKKNEITLERSVKKWTKIMRNRSRVSKLVAKPFFSQGSPHIWFDALCILHAPYFWGQTLNTITILFTKVNNTCIYIYMCVYACIYIYVKWKSKNITMRYSTLFIMS